MMASCGFIYFVQVYRRQDRSGRLVRLLSGRLVCFQGLNFVIAMETCRFTSQIKFQEDTSHVRMFRSMQIYTREGPGSARTHTPIEAYNQESSKEKEKDKDIT